MKKILKAFAVIICMMLCTYAYTQTLTVKFTGRDQTGQHYVKLDHVKTFNLDQLWEEVLYFPDTTLVLGGVGIIDYGNSSNSQLEQNVPNPFNGTTHFTLYLREGSDALLEIFDLMGKTVISQYYANLSTGAHLFSANLTNPQVYILKVSVKNEQMHLKMVNEGFGTENSINYVSVAAQSNNLDSETKNGQSLGIYPFHNGDELQHTGYTVINGVEYKSETITQRQNESETLILPFNLTPTVITNEVSNITSSSAVCGGSVSYTGEAMIVNKGICWSTAIGPTINENHTSVGAGTGDFTSIMTNLNPGTTYYVRAYATSSANITGYGEQVTFNTLATIPSVTTSVVSNITDNSATCGGNVTSDGGATVTARGICWSTNQNPTIGDNHTTDGSGTGAFTSSITGLVPNATYYVRAYATNSVGTAYGEVFTFTTTYVDAQPCPSTPTLTDYDGNIYNTVQIGSQCWMKENLRTTCYANGDSIALDTGTSYTTPYRYKPNNDANNVATYGYLYNWPAVMHSATSSSANPSGVQGICPTGWHVPSDSEWTQLIDYVGSQTQYQCGNSSTYIAKALASTTGWNSHTNTCTVGNNPSSNNATGFSALPAGGGSIGYYFHFGGIGAYFWSATEHGEDGAYSSNLQYGLTEIFLASYYKYVGSSVRCVRDETSGGEETFITVPIVTTDTVSDITSTSTACGGNVTSDGGATVTARGVCWSTSQNPTISDSHTTNGSGIGSFTSNLTGLTAGTTYYVRAYATNSAGTAYGEQQNFTTSLSVSLPTVTTNTVSNITNITASCGGNVTSDGDSTVTARGVCWSTSQNPTISDSHTTNGSGTGSFTSNLTGLTAGTIYYVRAYATNSAGTAYGNEVSFTTTGSTLQDGQPCPGVATVTDIDNNTYNTVQIGNQCWMKENLRTTSYSNGTNITLGNGTSTTTAYRYYPNNNSSNVATYGYLYNWNAVMGGSSSSWANPSGIQGVCPTGWHVPSYAEWTQLTDYVRSQSQYVCGSNNTYIAKALASTTGWNSHTSTCAVGNNPSANNSTSFSALPVGYYDGAFGLFGDDACFWSATEYDDGYPYNCNLHYSTASVYRGYVSKRNGFSVRCIRD